MGNLSVFHGSTWKSVTKYNLFYNNSWVPVKKGFVRRGTEWKQFWGDGLTITISPTEITCSDIGKTPITNTPVIRYDQTTNQYIEEYIWFNLDLGTILNTFGVNDATRSVVVEFNGVKIGGRHGKVIISGSSYDLDTSYRAKYAFTVGTNVLPTNIIFRAINGQSYIQGFGGFAMEQYDALFTTVSDTSKLGQQFHEKDIFGVDVCFAGLLDGTRQNSGWYPYTTAESKGGAAVTEDSIGNKIMKIASAYIDLGPITVWEDYKTFIRNLAIVKKILPLRTNSTSFVPTDYFSSNGVGQSFNSSTADCTNTSYNGGHALLLMKDITYEAQSGSLNVYSGCGGGRFGNSQNIGTNPIATVYLPHYAGVGGMGIPGGLGALGGAMRIVNGQTFTHFYGYYPRVNAPITGTKPVRWETGSFRAGEIPTVFIANNTDKMARFAPLYGTRTTYAESVYDSYNNILKLIPNPDNICLVSGVNTYSTNILKSSEVTSPGLAVKYNGKTITNMNPLETMKIIGPELLNGDGTQTTNWR